MGLVGAFVDFSPLIRLRRDNLLSLFLASSQTEVAIYHYLMVIKCHLTVIVDIHQRNKM